MIRTTRNRENIMSLTRFLSYLAVGALLAMSATGSARDPAPKKQPAKAVKLDSLGDPVPEGAVARLGTTRFRHASPVMFVGYSGDGGVLVTMTGDNSLRFWDVRTGKQ